MLRISKDVQESVFKPFDIELQILDNLLLGLENCKNEEYRVWKLSPEEFNCYGFTSDFI